MAMHRLSPRKVYLSSRKLAGSQTAKDSLVLFIGNFLNSLLALVAVIFVSRSLGPENFGILATFNAVSAAIIGFTNFGLDTAAIKIISSHLTTDKQRATAAMKVVFKLEIAIGLIIGIIGLFFSRPIAELLGGEHLLFAVRMAFFASIFGSAAAFIGPFFVAYRQFKKNAVVGLLGGIVRTIAVLILASASALTLSNVLWAYAAVPIVFFIAGVLTAPKDWRLPTTQQEEKEAATEIFHLSKWILLSYIATVIAGKLDVFLLSRMQGSTAVGLYAAALQLASVMPLLIGAISTAVLPRFSQFAKEKRLGQYFNRTLLGSFLLVIALLPVLIFSSQLIHVIFGDKYNASIPVFRILFSAYLIALMGNILSLALYALDKPRVLTYVNYGGLATTIIFYPLFISWFGITGAAWAFLINNAWGTILSIYLSKRAINKAEHA
jgi:O-antigen/teichoic acid export membrane protein